MEVEDYEYFNSSAEGGFERLYEEENCVPCKEEGWELFRRTIDCEVWRKPDTTHKVDIVKAYHSYRGIPPNAVNGILMDMEHWKNWDRRLPSAKVLEVKKHSRVIYWRMKLPYCVNERDMIHEVIHKDVEETQTRYILFQHVSNHSQRSRKENMIRMKTYFFGLIVSPHDSYPNSTSVTQVMQVDTDGWLPTFLANRYLAKAPLLWHKLLSSYYWGEYSKYRMRDTTSQGTDSVDEQVEEIVSQSGYEEEDDDSFENDSLVVEARKTVQKFRPQNQDIVEKLCTEISDLAQQLEDFEENDDGDADSVTRCAEVIREKLEELEKEMQTAIADLAVNNFTDPEGTLNTLIQATLSLPDSDEREELYYRACEAFRIHASKMAETAKVVATCSVMDPGTMPESKLRKEIRHNAKLTNQLAIKTVEASKSVFNDSSDLDAKGIFQAYKENYLEQVDKLTSMVDIAVPRKQFLQKSERALEEQMKGVTDQSYSGAEEVFDIVLGSTQIVNRVVAVISEESKSCNDDQQREALKHYVSTLSSANDLLPMKAQEATNDGTALGGFESAAKKVLSALHDLIAAVEVQHVGYTCEDNDELEVATAASTVSIVFKDDEIEIIEEEEIQDIDDEDVLEIEVTCFSANISTEKSSGASDAIEHAAYSLEQEASQWESSDNALVEAAARMAHHMKMLAKYARDEEAGLNKEWIDVARKIVEESQKVIVIAQMVTEVCTDSEMKKALQQVISKIQTISTQLKILASVKAGDNLALQYVQVAIEMLRDNSQNLMSTVAEILYATETATIRVPQHDRNKLGLKWVKK